MKMSLEEQVYLESLEVLSDMDEHEALVQETLDTPPSSPDTGHRVRRQLAFSSPVPPPTLQGAEIMSTMDNPIRPTTREYRRNTPLSSFSMIQVEEEANDGFYRNNQETFTQIYSKSVIPDADNDYCTPFENLPEYKAYQCVRSLRRNKRCAWMTFLLLFLSVPVLMRVGTMSSTLSSPNNSSTIFRERSIHMKQRLAGPSHHAAKKPASTMVSGQPLPVSGQHLPYNKTAFVATAKNSSVGTKQHTGANATTRPP